MSARFARIPADVLDLLADGTLPLRAVGLLAALSGKECDYETGEWRGSLTVLCEAVSYPHGKEQLRRDLHDAAAVTLADGRPLLDFETRTGSKTCTVRLHPAFGVGSKRNLHRTSTEPTPSGVEVASTEHGDEDLGIEDLEPLSSLYQPPPTRPLQKQNLEKKTVTAALRKEQAFRDLLDVLPAADPNTEKTLLAHFGHLDADAFEEARDAVLNKDDLNNPAGYANNVLRNIAERETAPETAWPEIPDGEEIT